jgi:two-component system, chemotaxis family, protein-glutamate methylesterase/glutaminase
LESATTLACVVDGADIEKSLHPTAIVIGASAGGPQALPVVIHDLGPLIASVPVLIALHIPPEFISAVTARIESATGRRPMVAHEGAALSPGHVFLSPGDRHVAIRRRDDRSAIALLDTPPENFCKPSIDVLFRSAAEALGPHVLGIILTGMGSDGVAGARAIVAAGGTVIAQDAKSSAVWGIPRLVANEGLATAVLPLKEIGGWVCRHVRQSPRRERKA